MKNKKEEKKRKENKLSVNRGPPEKCENVPQRNIGRDLHFSPSAAQNIIKPFKKSGEIPLL